jgi:hypothetical protein
MATKKNDDYSNRTVLVVLLCVVLISVFSVIMVINQAGKSVTTIDGAGSSGDIVKGENSAPPQQSTSQGTVTLTIVKPEGK